MSLDWVSHNLYWTETDPSGTKPKGRVMVAKQDGRYRRSLIDTGRLSAVFYFEKPPRILHFVEIQYLTDPLTKPSTT